METELKSMKTAISIVSVLLLLSAVYPDVTAEDFDYGHFGKDWHGACESGNAQSPINIVTANAVPVTTKKEFYLDYAPDSEVTLVNTGSGVALRLSNTSNNYLYTSEGKFRLAQFHFHVFSEHAIDGLFGPMEIHFVHVNDNNTHISVLGIRARLDPKNQPNPFFNQFFQYVPNNTVSRIMLRLNIKQFLQPPKSKRSDFNFYSYPGSLTTPPCSEIVTWYVLKRKTTISVAQMLTISDADASVSENNRLNDRLPVPLGNRRLTYHKVV
eukprot:TRINITY_DN884_c0_g1_i1.p1 TRINITY_DN884_c0_g1~~TRINITY_DN884_c0_g1_i1.p1  ORF type:complete len:269 (-),score=33.22 TRINITY_DN884_c0_g1_i1:637-1443(-)